MRRTLVTMSVLALLAVAAGCQTGVQMWAPCTPAADGDPSGTDGTWILVCEGGEWVPLMTVDEFIARSRGQNPPPSELPQRPTATPGPTTTTTTTQPPVKGASQVVGGAGHTCALTRKGTVSCWGDNRYGQLGSDTGVGTSDPNPTPAAVADLTGVTQIAAGNTHTCALGAAGTVSCWGLNSRGELGRETNFGTTNPNPTPAAVAGLTGVTQITAGNNNTCALLENRTVSCWGAGPFGKLGHSGSGPTVQMVTGLANVTEVAAGAEHVCALLADKTVSCWGLNFHGQLGRETNLGTIDPNPTAAPVAGLTGITQISSGGYFTCAVDSIRTVSCWGENLSGQLGNSTNYGTSDPNPVPLVVGSLGNVDRVAAGLSHACAIHVDGTLSCWGRNDYGQLGNDTGGSSPTPSSVLFPTFVSHVAAGGHHTCTVLDDHSVSCWGWNLRGQLGSATNSGTTSNPVPTTVVGID